jgi:hypothetical protein
VNERNGTWSVSRNKFFLGMVTILLQIRIWIKE